VVALRAGAVVETMRDGETAILFDDPGEVAFEAAIRKALCHPWNDARCDPMRPVRPRTIHKGVRHGCK